MPRPQPVIIPSSKTESFTKVHWELLPTLLNFISSRKDRQAQQQLLQQQQLEAGYKQEIFNSANKRLSALAGIPQEQLTNTLGNMDEGTRQKFNTEIIQNIGVLRQYGQKEQADFFEKKFFPETKKTGKKLIERTIDLGNKVRVIYTNGKAETIDKGRFQTPSNIDKYVASKAAAFRETNKGKEPNKTQLSDWRTEGMKFQFNFLKWALGQDETPANPIGEYTDEELQHTADKYNMTIPEVKERLGIK